MERESTTNSRIDEYGCLSGRVLKVTTVKSRKGSIVISSEKSEGNFQEWQVSNLLTEQFGNLEELKQGTLVRLLNFKIESDESYRARPTQNSVIWEVPVGF